MKFLDKMKHHRRGSAVLGGDDFDYSMLPEAAAEIIQKFIPKPKGAAAATTPAAGAGGGGAGGAAASPGKGGGGGGGGGDKSGGPLGVPYWIWALGGVAVAGGAALLIMRRRGGGQ